MGKSVTLLFVKEEDGKFKRISKLYEKWCDTYNDALHGSDVMAPMFPLRGRHQLDTRSLDPDDFYHSWFTLAEVETFDWDGYVTFIDGRLDKVTWREFMDDDDYFRTLCYAAQLSTCTHCLFHFDQ